MPFSFSDSLAVSTANRPSVGCWQNLRWCGIELATVQYFPVGRSRFSCAGGGCPLAFPKKIAEGVDRISHQRPIFFSLLSISNGVIALFPHRVVVMSSMRPTTRRAESPSAIHVSA